MNIRIERRDINNSPKLGELIPAKGHVQRRQVSSLHMFYRSLYEHLIRSETEQGYEVTQSEHRNKP